VQKFEKLGQFLSEVRSTHVPAMETNLRLSNSWQIRQLITNCFESDTNEVCRDPEDNVAPHAVPDADIRKAHQWGKYATILTTSWSTERNIDVSGKTAVQWYERAVDVHLLLWYHLNTLCQQSYKHFQNQPIQFFTIHNNTTITFTVVTSASP